MSARSKDDLLQSVRRSLERDRELPLPHMALKALRYGASLATAPVYLMACNNVGPGVRTRCRPLVDNGGYISIGARSVLNSMFCPVELFTGRRGRIEIGEAALINWGAAIHADDRITVGDRVRFGPYVRMSDRDTEHLAERGPKPITIGDDVWLASRVRVRGGSVIGAGSVIAAGSDVTGEIPPYVVAAGSPARVVRSLSRENPEEILASAVAAEEAPRPDTGGSDRDGPLLGLPRLAVNAAGSAFARLLLVGVNSIGARPRVHGRPFIENLGEIFIGDDVRLMSTPVRLQLVTGKDGAIRIGDGVAIDSGVSIGANTKVDIGDGARLGASVMLMDSDFHAVDDRSAEGLSAPILIEAHARIDERVVVLRGAHIGRHARVAAGSVVAPGKHIPDGAFAAGIPARVISHEPPSKVAVGGREG